MQESKPEILYANISAEQEPCVMESICPNCEESGKTTILLTNIPFFKEIIIVSFYCEHCGERNSEVQFGGKIAEQGILYQFTAEDEKDLNREIIKSEHGCIRIPSLEFEIPSNKKGVVNTIEGFISNTIKDLEKLQALRHIQDPENAKKIDEFLDKMRNILNGLSFPLLIEVQDPSGNSYIQNPLAPHDDPRLRIKHYNRTVQETETMGYSLENEKQEFEQEKQEQQAQNESQNKANESITAHKRDFSKPLDKDSLKEEAYSFTGPCHVCFQEGEHKMCTVSIPYFKDILIMSYNCLHCGAKSTEVKSGGEITQHGKIIILKAKDEQDLKRDLFKSETAGLSIPELELELASGTLGGVYTTVEGILEKIQQHLHENNPFAGDSDPAFKKRMDQLFQDLKNLRSGQIPFTLIITDLLDNSFLQNPNYPDPDPNVSVQVYHRTEEDDEHLGIDKMKTENYNAEYEKEEQIKQ